MLLRAGQECQPAVCRLWPGEFLPGATGFYATCVREVRMTFAFDAKNRNQRQNLIDNQPDQGHKPERSAFSIELIGSMVVSINRSGVP